MICYTACSIGAALTPCLSAFFNSLRPKLAIIDLHLLGRIPSYWSLPIYFLVTDLVGYWIHRLQHIRFFWPFHSVHHSQQSSRCCYLARRRKSGCRSVSCNGFSRRSNTPS